MGNIVKRIWIQMLECNSFENLSVTLQYSSETKFCYENPECLCFTYNEEGWVKTLRELIALSNQKKTINPKYTFFFFINYSTSAS